MLNPVAFASSLAVLTAAFYVLFGILRSLTSGPSGEATMPLARVPGQFVDALVGQQAGGGVCVDVVRWLTWSDWRNGRARGRGRDTQSGVDDEGENHGTR